VLAKQAGLDALLIVSEKNMRYLAGFNTLSLERFAAVIIPTTSVPPVVIVPQLEKTKADDKCAFEEIKAYSDSESPASLFSTVIKDLELEKATFGVEGTLPFRYYSMLTGKSSQRKAVDASPFFSQLRLIKSKDELELIEKAAGFVAQGIQAGIEFTKAGVTELEISCQIEHAIKESGGESVPFCLVLSGPNSAIPHGETSNRKVANKDVVLMDIGATYEGYCGDLTRTIFVGKPSEQQKQVYQVVSDAHDEAIKTVKPNVPAEKIDSAARNIIQESGYGQYFTHRTGHGLGLDVHEEPYIVQGNKTKLASGMTFTVEPGIYFFNKYGIRIEDNIAVSNTGKKMLSNMPTKPLTV
jgi:Xaa-Pro aminopeptidase